MNKLFKSRFIAVGVRTGLALILIVLAYTIWWSIWYRLPAQPDQILDLRSDKVHGSCYITFCAGLADNPIGFPGHAYVNWSTKANTDPLEAESVGFITREYNDQFVSPFVSVPGTLHYHAALYNQRNLECLAVIVDPLTYNRTILAREKWNTREFKALQRDCLSFSTYIAQASGLRIPEHRCLYPQDQLRQLKALNKAAATTQ